MANPALRAKLDRGEFFLAPGMHDMIAATLVRDMDFDCAYASGYWTTASAYGLPDAGIATYTQMLDRVATLARTLGPEVALIADADTGYGGLLNVHHTVRGYREAGVTAIQLEDQEFPKKCGHTPFKRVVSTDTMVAKIRVAKEAAAADPGMLVIARTDALASEGLEQTLRRAQAYAAAGADILFVEALESDNDMAAACRAVDAPMMANMADGGRTPIRSASELERLGFAGAIFPATTALAAAAAIEHALARLKATGSSVADDVPLYDFNRFCRQIGFEEVWAFERKWGGVE